MSIQSVNPDSDSTEPLVTVGAITAAVTAVLGLLVAFGLPISDDQQARILGVIAVAAPFVVTFWGRRQVYAPATVTRLLRGRNG
ncbi:hypothetical protein AB0C47_34830 [Micromonospora taraxaci]|uniref:hypothetical protein n=1 Tax=Micromonospora taraxaci TaxID=1316803 RepID=UPI0033EBE6B3